MTRRALITGPTSGIGNAYARELARRGYDLVLVARDTERLESIAEQLSNKHRIDVDVITAEEDRQLDLLVRAPMHLMDAAIKVMAGRRGGQIINVSSVAAYTPRGAYSAHKAWLLNLSEWANIHYADVNISVMALCPGFVRTEFHQRGQMDTSAIPKWMWLKADKLVKTSLKDLEKGKSVSIPTIRYKVLALLARYLPKGVVTRFAKRGR
jgi:short-subunit dehydrogenase